MTKLENSAFIQHCLISLMASCLFYWIHTIILILTIIILL